MISFEASENPSELCFFRSKSPRIRNLWNSCPRATDSLIMILFPETLQICYLSYLKTKPNAAPRALRPKTHGNSRVSDQRTECSSELLPGLERKATKGKNKVLKQACNRKRVSPGRRWWVPCGRDCAITFFVLWERMRNYKPGKTPATRSRLRRLTPPREAGGKRQNCGPKHPSRPPPARPPSPRPSSWPGRPPPRRADGISAEAISDPPHPRDPGGWLWRSKGSSSCLLHGSPGARQAQSKNKARDATARSMASCEQQRSDELVSWEPSLLNRTGESLEGGKNPHCFLGDQNRKQHLFLSRAGRRYF